VSIRAHPFVVMSNGNRRSTRNHTARSITMAQYLLSVWHDDVYEDNDFDDPDTQRMFAQVDAFNQKITAEGNWVFGGGLLPTTAATVVRAAAGDVSMTDGPYAETKEQMGGFWVIEAPDLDVALDLASQAAAACEGPVEVRPFQGE
jgi:hypothetical protein